MTARTSPLATALGLDPARIARRLQAAGLDAGSLAELSRHADAAAQALPHVLDAFYRRVRDVPEMAALLADPALERRLRAAHADYTRSLFAGTADLAYVESRLRIGDAHHRVRLQPHWYLAAYCLLLEGHLERLLQAGHADAAVALVQRVLFDAALALDAYGMNIEREMRSARATTDLAAPRQAGAGPAGAPAAPPVAAASPTTHVQLVPETPQQRREFLGLDATTLATLRDLSPLIARTVPALLDEFYAFFSANAETARLVPPAIVARLRDQVAAYWHELAQGAFDRPYASSRLRIGVMHERIGLSPQWYLAGLSRQVCGLLRAILADGEPPRPRIQALLRAVFFDVSFVIDAYMEARAEAVLSQEGYASRLVASLVAGIAVLDQHHRILSINMSLSQLLGIDPALLPHMPIEAALPLPGVTELLGQLVCERRSQAIGRLHGRDLRLTAVRLDPAPDAPEAQYALVVDDIGDLRRFATNLDRGSLQAQVLADATTSMLWTFELPSWTVHAVTRQVLAFTGRRDLAIVGRPGSLLGCVPAGDRARLQHAAANLAPGQETECEHAFVHADGSLTPVLTHLRRLPDEGGHTMIAATSTDVGPVHARRDREIALVGQIAGGIAHEINNSLLIAMGELQLMDLGGMRAETQHGRNQALHACQRAADVTRKLLAFARRQFLQPREADLGLHLRNLEPQLAGVLGERHRVVLELVATDARCRLDWKQFDLTLEQLAENARNAMPVAGTLHITLADGSRDDLELVVADDGSGMSADIAVRAAEPFFTTKGGRHLGLGLAAAHGFFAQSGCEFVIDSALGKGTSIRVRIPRRPAPPARATPGQKPVLLVVEDEEHVRDLVSRLARRAGFDVLGAASAEEALRLCKANPPDAAFCDVVLGPGMSGIALAEQFRRDHPALPIALTSGYAPHQVDRDERAAVFPFLQKPYLIEQLQTMLASLLAASRAAIRG